MAGLTRKRRRLLVLSGVLLGLLGGMALGCCGLLYKRAGGAFRGPPSAMEANLSPGARKLLEDALAGLGSDGVVDYHVHLIGRDINPDWVSWCHPLQRARTMVYLSAAGVGLNDSVVEDYEARLLDLVRHIPTGGRFHVLALDRTYRADGTADPERTQVHVPNERAIDLARRHPGLFIPVVSIHPYRADAIAELEKWAAAGGRHVKWIPNAMGIDPSSERLDPFYLRMRRLGMILLSHTGLERALEAGDQDFGNPLLLRRPLDLGVRVVALHSACDGTSADLDSPRREEVPSFDLFVRLLGEPRYEGFLFGEISTLTFFRNAGGPLRKLLGRPDLHHRFVNGSDYPISAINVALRTSTLVSEGLITNGDRTYLNEIYGYNPLLFDLAVKRTVRHPETGTKLAHCVFRVPGALR